MKPFKETKAFGIIKTVLPSLAGAVPVVGPAAASLITSVLSKHDTGEINLSPEAIATLQAELNEMYALENADRANARSREIAIAATSKKDWMMSATGIVVLSAFVGVIMMVALRSIPATNKDIFNILVGAVSTAAGSIIQYYFGSSRGSREKNDTIKNIINDNQSQ